MQTLTICLTIGVPGINGLNVILVRSSNEYSKWGHINILTF